MKRRCLFLTILCLAGFCPAESVITNVAGLHEITSGRKRFDLTVGIVCPTIRKHHTFVGRDDSGYADFHTTALPSDLWPSNATDIVRITGDCSIFPGGVRICQCTSLEPVGRGTPDKPADMSDDQLTDDALLGQWRRLRGTVRGVFADDIDPDYAFISLSGSRRAFYVNTCIADCGLAPLQALLGREVTADGFVYEPKDIQRFKSGRMLFAPSPHTLRPTDESDRSVFEAPVLTDLAFKDPAELLTHGRCRTTGKVLATWNNAHLLLKSFACGILRVDLANERLPGCGETIEVSGFPETDFFRVNLSCAKWRPYADRDPEPDTPSTDIRIRDIFSDEAKRPRVHQEYQGQPVQLTGRVDGIAPNRRQLTLRDEIHTVTVDASSLTALSPSLEPGCEIAVSGICVIDTGNWRSPFDFPHIHDVLVCVRDPQDIVLVSRPSRWTPGRLLAIVGFLVAALVLVLVWNALLRRLVEKRSRQLADESLAHAESSLKIGERTRLAVELHDSVAQTLSGISLEIDTAERLADSDLRRLHTHLTVASLSLKSCRDEIRNCIWDLRTRALELDDIAEAIRQTLLPHLGDTRLTVRFSVPRDRVSDSTMHVILRIIRELTINAIRHGHAQLVQVAGSIEGDRLLFSVRDDGCGFDPANAPGLREGHFGLQGIRERVEGLEGEIDIASHPPEGTKVTISLHLPKECST